MSDSTTTPRPPDIGRRSLTPFGYAVVIIVPFVLTGLGFLLLHLNYSPEDNVTGARVPILNSGWKDGQPTGTEVLSGKLELTGEGCVVVDTGGTQETAVWPFDFEATVEDDELKLYDTDRSIAAKSDDTVQVQGTTQSAEQWAGQQCAPGPDASVFVVQSDVVVTQQP